MFCGEGRDFFSAIKYNTPLPSRIPGPNYNNFSKNHWQDNTIGSNIVIEIILGQHHSEKTPSMKCFACSFILKVEITETEVRNYCGNHPGDVSVRLALTGSGYRVYCWALVGCKVVGNH